MKTKRPLRLRIWERAWSWCVWHDAPPRLTAWVEARFEAEAYRHAVHRHNASTPMPGGASSEDAAFRRDRGGW